MRSNYRSDAIKVARVPVLEGRRKWSVPCAVCGTSLKLNEVKVDHVIPCGSLKEWKDIEGFIRRLFVSVDGLQCLCKDCHDRKTKEERKK